MAKESIDTIISQEALEQFIELGRRLDNVYAKMESLIGKVFDLNKAMSSAGGAREAANAMNEQSKAAEELNKTNSERLNVERKIKEEGTKMAEAVKGARVDYDELAKVLAKYANTLDKSAKEVLNLKTALETNKKSIKDLDKTSADYEKRLVELTQEQELLKSQLSDEQKEFKKLTKETQYAEGSYRQMQSRLSKLTDIYRGLSQAEKENANVGGILKAEINKLDESLKGMDKSIGQNQRNVGNYEIAVKGLETEYGTLRQALRGIREGLAQQMIELDNVNGKIKQQQTLVLSLAQSKGKESAEYKTAAAELENLTAAQTAAAKSIQTLQNEGGKLQDIYGDASSKVKALSSDFANTDAAVQGVGVMIDAYTVLQSSMVALGIESDALMDIFAKLMILQQGLNSVSQITKALQSESILRTKLETVWMKVKDDYNKRLIASQSASNVATKAGNVAQGSSVGIIKKVTTAVKAMNKALMANPWIILAVAIIAAVAALVKFIGNQKAEKVEALNKVIDAQTKSFERHSDQVDKNVDKMKALGMSEQQIIEYKKNAIKVDYLAAKATMERMRANKNATQEQLNAVTEAYNEQNKLYRDILHEEEVLRIKTNHDTLQKINEDNAKAAEDRRKKAQDEANKRIEDEKNYVKRLNEELYKLEYDKKSSIDKVRADIAKLEEQRQADLLKYPAQSALINKYYEEEKKKVREEYREKELKDLDYVQSRTLEGVQNGIYTIKKSYDELSKSAQLMYETEINEAIKAGVKGEELEKLKYEAKKKWHLEEIKLFELRKEELIKQGMSEEEYFAKLSQMQADGIISEQDYTNKVLQMNEQIKQKRMDAFKEMVGGFASLGSAIAQNIQDEKQRMRVEAAIALAQALVNEGLAIAQVINDPGDPYLKAFRIVANVAAIAAAMVTATTAFQKASAAMPYAEGTDYHKGGAALIGEAGEPEIVMIKNREPFVIDKPTLIKDFPVGAKVIPMHKADNVMSLTETNELLKAIKNKATVSVNVSDELTTYIQSKLNITKVIGGYFKA